MYVWNTLKTHRICGFWCLKAYKNYLIVRGKNSYFTKIILITDIKRKTKMAKLIVTVYKFLSSNAEWVPL